MKKISFEIALFILAGLISIQSCQYEYIKPKPVIIQDSVSFSKDIIPFLTNSCSVSGCHDEGGVAPDLTEANAYDNLMLFELIDTANPDLSPIYLKITTGNMSSYATAQDAEYLLKWIKEGAHNN